MAGLIVEILDRNGAAVHTHGFDAFPVRIGRGYGNDLILPDAYVCADHLLIDRDEHGFVVADLGSRNGVYVQGRRIPGASVHLISGDTLSVGGTRLRLLAPSHPVPPAAPLGFWSKAAGKTTFRILAWASLLPTCGALLGQEYLSSTTVWRSAKLLGEVIPQMALVVVWAGLWSLVGFSVRRHMRFHAQLMLANGVLLAALVLEAACGQLAFALNFPALRAIGSFAGRGGLFAVLLFGNLALAGEMVRRRRALASAIAAVVAVLVAVILHIAEQPEFEHAPAIATVLKPPYVKLAPSLTVDEFLQRSREAFSSSRRRDGARPGGER